MQLSTKQQYFIDLALGGSNIYLTGKAGTGKSSVVKLLMDKFKERNRKVIAVAPTGIAANNVDGQTIHSMFTLNPYGVMEFSTCNFFKSQKKKLLDAVETIIIDEISMLRPDILDAMNWALIKNGLGGLETKQIIFVGDLKQLPAILDDNTRSVLYQTYNGDQFIDAKVYPKLNVVEIELDEVHRQTNAEFIHHLNIIRDGGRSEYFRRFVSQDPLGIILAPHNATVSKYNKRGLEAQSGEEYVFIAEVTGNAKADEFNLEQEVRVKNGCKIMYLVNSTNNPLRNGTLGIFTAHAGCNYIRVGEVDYALEKVEVTKKEYIFNPKTDKLELTEIGTIKQFPIKLACALSIHKAQGLTFEEVTLDLTRPCFQKAQMYVALSRVKSPEGLRIITPAL